MNTRLSWSTLVAPEQGFQSTEVARLKLLELFWKDEPTPRQRWLAGYPRHISGCASVNCVYSPHIFQHSHRVQVTSDPEVPGRS